MSELVLVYRTFDVFKANLIKSQLDDLDIYCFVKTHDASGTLPHLGFAQGGFEIMVLEKDLDEAEKILLELEK